MIVEENANPVEGLNFFQVSLRNCINCVLCDDHFFISLNMFLRNSTSEGFAYINFDKVSWNNRDKDRMNTNSLFKRHFRCRQVVRSSDRKVLINVEVTP